MDLVSKRIILELNKNCRISLQALAKTLDLSVNAVKKRLNNLTEMGVIREYYIYPSLAMIDAESAVAFISAGEPTPDKGLVDKLGTNPMVYAVSILSTGKIFIFADYVGSKGLAELNRFFRQFPEVENVEFHTLITERGQKLDLKEDQLKVLRCLREDARMPISKIASQTQLSVRRVRRILKEFLGDGGSADEFFVTKKSLGDVQTAKACINFRVAWDLNAAGATAFVIRIDINEQKATRGDVVDWLQQKFSTEFWYAYASATTPTLFNAFVVEHMRQAAPIVEEIGKSPLVDSVETIFGYPTKRFDGLREAWFQKMLNELRE